MAATAPPYDSSILKRSVEKLIDHLELSDRAFALQAGLNSAWVSQLKTGRIRAPRDDTLAKLAHMAQCPPDALKRSDYEPSRYLGAGAAGAAQTAPGPHEPEMIDFAGESYVMLPAYDIEAAAGDGAYNEHAERLYHLPFRAQQLRAITDSQPSALAVIRVRGDSMWQTLHNGDHVLVDRRVQHVGSDGLYVIRLSMESDIMVKRVQVVRGGALTVISDNPAYERIVGIDPAELHVMGRVVWLGRQMV